MWGSGFGVQGLGFRVWGLRFKGLGFGESAFVKVPKVAENDA